MQAASRAYKLVMKEKWRNQRSFIRVTIGLINQEAQEGAYIPDPGCYTYYSNLKRPLDNYRVDELYAVCDQDYSTVDGGMFFLPRKRQDVVLNQGIVTEDLLGAVEIRFPAAFDIKGLTVEFGSAFPVDFSIESDNGIVEVAGNKAGHFVTEEIFTGSTYLRFIPTAMVNGQSRLRIHQLAMGIGIYFDNRTVLSAAKKEYISPVMEQLPAIDFDLTIDNKNRAYDIENDRSTVNFLETGQNVEVLYGQELADGTVEWMPGAALSLREWSADDKEMHFSASDRFDTMDGTYYRGRYRPDGISLYDLAVDVMDDAGVDSRTYWIDQYLRDVVVYNPVPVVRHKEALQLIAGAGRCVLYQNRVGVICLKSSFVPDMASASDNGAYYSHPDRILDMTVKDAYASAAQDYTDVIPTQYFMLGQTEGAAFLNTGYISEAVADAGGFFSVNPTVEVTLEAAYKCFGMTLEFGRNYPDEVLFHAYRDGEAVEDYAAGDLEGTAVIPHEFPEFDRLVLEFTKGRPHNRIVLDNIAFGDGTDYILEYGHELSRTPKGTQLAKVRELQVIRTLFHESEEIKELVKETVTVSERDNRYTFYFSGPSYDLACAVTEPGAGCTAVMVESSSYSATVEIMGDPGAFEVVITGREFTVSRTRVGRRLNSSGSLEIWENPLVSDGVHAADLADWIGDCLRADREYDLAYRGEPRIDANDIMFLENKYVPDLLLRVYDHTLNFNGAFSGTMKARRDMSYTADDEDGVNRRLFNAGRR